jgi:hypothetical protein
MGRDAELRQVETETKEAQKENAGDLKDAMQGGCSTSAMQTALSSLTRSTSTIDKIQDTVASLNNSFQDSNLKYIYDEAKKNNDTALYNLYAAEQNNILNKNNGETEYNTLLVNRYTAQGKKDLEELNLKNVEVTNLLMDLIRVTQQQNIAVDNMQNVMKNLEEKNKQLLLFINGGKGDLHTYNRKSAYESKLKQSVENWTIIPEIAYWTLVILWVCIVMLYLKNVTFLSVGILIGLILYPYFSTTIYLWVLDKIQSIWNFIFIAVNNRISA